jgi:hypothetical protein
MVFGVIFAGALTGMGLRRVLPANELGADAKEVIRLAVGLLVTMTALVLGMLVSTANSSYQDRKNELAQMASDFVVVDRLLASYGPETHASRVQLRVLAEDGIKRIWPSRASQESRLKPTESGQVLYDQLRILVPKNDTQAATKAAAITAAVGLRQTYWLMFLRAEQSSLSFPLLVVVVAWLTSIFLSFGLFAPHNHTVIVTLVVCALAVSAAIFIIMEMYMPFSGVMRLSPAPIRDALGPMGT